MVVRPSAVAGQFYPDDPHRLQRQVSDLLARIATPVNGIPKALIAPHAGYIYSGAVAAARHLRHFAVARKRLRASY